MKAKSDVADDFETYKKLLLELGVSETEIDKRIAELRAETEIAQHEISEFDLLNSPAWR